MTKTLQPVRFVILLISVLGASLTAGHAGATELDDFLANNERYHYQILGESHHSLREGRLLSSLTRLWSVHQLLVHSTRWQPDQVKPARWRNEVLILVPRFSRGNDKALLLIDGGRNDRHFDLASKRFGKFELPLGLVAKLTGATIVVLRQIPNAPLAFEGQTSGLTEDNAIAHSFERFFETGDGNWPLLFPMVNSVVHAMSATQGFLGERYRGRTPQSFVITGTSKRGWTAWLTAAADERVAAISPVVFDMLNLPAQLKAQQTIYGSYSEQLLPYSESGVIDKVLEHSLGQRLTAMVDPFSYRERLTLPKLVILTTGDDYWTLTSANHYRDELPGETRVHYRANCDHSCSGKDDATIDLYTLNAELMARLKQGQVLPPEPLVHREGDELLVRLPAGQAPQRLMLWYAHAPNSDFRFQSIGDAWQHRDIVEQTAEREWRIAVPRKAGHHTGYYVDAEYPSALYHDSRINRWLLDRSPYRDAASRIRISSRMQLDGPAGE